MRAATGAPFRRIESQRGAIESQMGHGAVRIEGAAAETRGIPVFFGAHNSPFRELCLKIKFLWHTLLSLYEMYG